VNDVKQIYCDTLKDCIKSM